jgi:hypothetical protein
MLDDAATDLLRYHLPGGEERSAACAAIARISTDWSAKCGSAISIGGSK